MFAFPESYGGHYCGIPLTEDALKEVGEVSGLPDENPEIYIHDERIKNACKRFLPEPANVTSGKAKEAYLYLRQNISNSHFNW